MAHRRVRARPAAPPHAATGDAGLTLLEMLIVLAVIAIATGATVLSLSPRRGNPTEVEARRLATTIQVAVDRSIATGANAALVVDAHGYAAAGGPRHPLPTDIVLSGAPGPALALTLDGAVPFDLVVARGGDAWRVAFDGVRAVAVPARDPA